MMLDDYLEPIDLSSIAERSQFSENNWGPHIKFYTGGPIEYSLYQIAILGVKDGRASIYNQDSERAPDQVRREFYFLYRNAEKCTIIDLGNVKLSGNCKDTYFAIASIVLELKKNNVFTIILGGGNDLIYGQYLGYQDLNQMINVTCVDERIDMKNTSTKLVNSESYLMPIFMHQPNYLFNYNHVAYQSYLCDPNELETLDSLNFDSYRLGHLRDDISETEPTLRVSDLLSIDVSAIKHSDAPGNANGSPNGLTSEEVCQLFRYAGYSDRLSSIGIYELNPTFDTHNMTAKLIGQCIWYFIEGFINKRIENPQSNDKDFLKYTVEFEDVDHQLVFWKSKRTDRWWMEIPFGDKEHFRRNQLIPCSYNDYLKACKEELPDRWMKAYNKLF